MIIPVPEGLSDESLAKLKERIDKETEKRNERKKEMRKLKLKYEPKTICIGDNAENENYVFQIVFGEKGVSFETMKKFSKEIHTFCTILAYREEFCPNYEPNWSDKDEEKFCVYFCNEDKTYQKYVYNKSQHIGVVCFPREIAEKLCEQLNNGEITL